MTKIDLAQTPEEIAIVRELFLEYQTQVGIDLCFQGFAAEVVGLPATTLRPPADSSSPPRTGSRSAASLSENSTQHVAK